MASSNPSALHVDIPPITIPSTSRATAVMSQVAQQIGKMNQVYALLATTNGRDKAYRFVQYLARLVAWYMIRRGKIDTADRFIGLRNGLMQARRALRLLRNGEFIQAAIKLSSKPVSSLSGPGQLAHFAQIGRQLGYAGYFATDQMLWLAGVGFTRPTKERLLALQRISMRCWLFGILFSIGSSTSSLVKLRADGRRFALAGAAARKELSEKTPEEKVRQEEERREKGRAMLAQRQTLLSQMITDACDVWIPSNNLGYTNLNDGIIGALGAFTSYSALQTLWLKHSAAASR